MVMACDSSFVAHLTKSSSFLMGKFTTNSRRISLTLIFTATRMGT
jgi:hypothetical protein